MQHSIFQVAWLCMGLALAGCSVSIPLPSLLSDDDDVTASIDKARARPAVGKVLPPKSAISAPVAPDAETTDPDAAKVPT